MNIKKICLTIAIFILAGCSTKWTSEFNGVGRYEAIEPQEATLDGTRKEAFTGDMIISSYKYFQQDKIHLKSTIRHKGINTRKMKGGLDLNEFPFTINIEKGYATLVGKDDIYKYYQLDELVEINYNRTFNTYGGVAVSSDSNHPDLIYWYIDRKGLRNLYLAKPENKIEYETKPSKLVAHNIYKGFGKTITYLGMSSGVLNFVYKEFQDSTIRSAFTQEFQFDYSPESEYRFKDSVFTVHKADANSIDYTVDTSFFRK